MRKIRRRKEQKPQWPGDKTICFKDVPMCGMFFLTPPNTYRVGFIKTHKWGAQVDNANNDSNFPDQEFPEDYPVFVLGPKPK